MTADAPELPRWERHASSEQRQSHARAGKVTAADAAIRPGGSALGASGADHVTRRTSPAPPGGFASPPAQQRPGAAMNRARPGRSWRRTRATGHRWTARRKHVRRASHDPRGLRSRPQRNGAASRPSALQPQAGARVPETARKPRPSVDGTVQTSVRSTERRRRGGVPRSCLDRPGGRGGAPGAPPRRGVARVELVRSRPPERR